MAALIGAVAEAADEEAAAVGGATPYVSTPFLTVTWFASDGLADVVDVVETGGTAVCLPVAHVCGPKLMF